MSAPWTPGPWRASPRFKSAVVAAHPVPGMRGSDDVPGYGGHLVAESVAPQNVPLIAAAPDLAEAAEPFAAIDFFPDAPSSAEAIKVRVSIEGTAYEEFVTIGDFRRIRAALSKAKGETE